VKAVVALKPHAIAPTEEELVTHCRALLAHFKAPRSIDFVDEIPKSAVGKILRRVVRERYWAGLERRIS
jgi:acyl-CoA synthetase (AMP-forming)/AMP-acid ligase II